MIVSEQFISKLNCNVRLFSYGNVRNCELAFSLFLVLKKIVDGCVEKVDSRNRSHRTEQKKKEEKRTGPRSNRPEQNGTDGTLDRRYKTR